MTRHRAGFGSSQSAVTQITDIITEIELAPLVGISITAGQITGLVLPAAPHPAHRLITDYWSAAITPHTQTSMVSRAEKRQGSQAWLSNSTVGIMLYKWKLSA